MVLDVGRVKHRADLMHRSTGSNGNAVPSNWRLSADGLKNVIWTPESASSVSYGSNSNDVSSANAPGASALVTRADHVHRGLRTVTSNGSNGLFGDVNLVAGTGIALGVTAQAITVTNTIPASSGGGGGSSGGFTHAYLGYDTIGGTWESMTSFRVYAKKITVSSAGILSAISAYVQATVNTSVGGGVHAAVFSDASGTPDNVVYFGGPIVSDTLLMDNNSGAGGVSRPRWLHLPCGMYVPAGDYWIAVQASDTSDTIQIAKDGSGSDRYHTTGGAWLADWGFYAATTTTDRYSIRASIIT